MRTRCLAIALLLASPAAAAAGPARTPFTADQLTAELSRALVDHFHLQGELDASPLRPWSPPAVQAADWQLSVTEFPTIASGTMLVRFRLLADGSLAAEQSVLLHAALWRDLWYTRERITAGTPFSSGLLTAQRTDVFRVHDGLPASEGDGSAMFSREMPPDRMVTWHDIARRPLVHKGEVVEAVASEGRLYLWMKALALENGARGDLINVRNLESQKTIPASVVGESRVEIHF